MSRALQYVYDHDDESDVFSPVRHGAIRRHGRRCRYSVTAAVDKSNATLKTALLDELRAVGSDVKTAVANVAIFLWQRRM